ncbi:MAG TPA: hypothetical protein VGO50_03555 [Pyrinomonadaceae bacterium]|jgi:hypothetical protein|nr:hypothetical protein [Pyrinomonadaceae bacterium]
MFCPNCAAQNETAQHYCRMCGLKLDAIVVEMTSQKPSTEMVELFKKQRMMRRLGVFSLTTAGGIGIALLFAQVIYYKLMILGPELLFGGAIGAVVLFLLASVFFFNYPKLFMKLDRSESHLSGQTETEIPTNKLLNDPPFEPAGQPASVTEHSTELLHRK